MLLKHLHCLNKVPKSSHLHSLNLALNVVINLVAKLFFSVENMFLSDQIGKWVTKQRRLLCRSFQKQSSKAPVIFMAWSKVFAILNDLLWQYVFITYHFNAAKNIAQDITLQDCYFPSFAMPYLTYWHQPRGNWITHWLEVGSFKLRADEDYMSFTWWWQEAGKEVVILEVALLLQVLEEQKGNLAIWLYTNEVGEVSQIQI